MSTGKVQDYVTRSQAQEEKSEIKKKEEADSSPFSS